MLAKPEITSIIRNYQFGSFFYRSVENPLDSYLFPLSHLTGGFIMIINLKEKGEVILFAEDPSKPEEHIFVYKLKNLDSALSEDDGADIYVAVPNGRNVSLIDLPKGSYSMEKLNK